MTAQEQNTLELFKEAAWTVAQKKIETLNLDDKIAKLGVDSLAMLEIVGYFEEKLNIRLPDEKLTRVQTVGDLAKVIAQIEQAAA